MIIKVLLTAPKEYISLMKDLINYIDVDVLIEALHDIIDEATEENVVMIMNNHIGAMRSILLALNLQQNNKTFTVKSVLEVIYKFIQKGAWKDNITWKGILLVLKKCREEFNIEEIENSLPEDHIITVKKELDILPPKE